MRVGNITRIGFGAQLSGELKIPVARGQSAVRFGAELGPYAQARFPLSENAAGLIRLGIGWRLVRQRYQFIGAQGESRKATEHAWASTISAGWVWQ